MQERRRFVRIDFGALGGRGRRSRRFGIENCAKKALQVISLSLRVIKLLTEDHQNQDRRRAASHQVEHKTQVIADH